MAVTSLERNRLRTWLSILGIAIGIAAVMCTAALGRAGTASVERQLDALGEDFLWIRAGSRNLLGVRTGFGGARTLTAADADAMAAEATGIAACSPLMNGREQVIAGGRNWNTRYQGVNPSYFDIRRRSVVVGTLFSEADLQDRTRVLVLGPTVAERLFPGENPVGKTIRMGRFPFRVVGVLASRGSERSGVDRDDVVFVPLTTAVRTLDRQTWVNDIMCGVTSPEVMRMAEAQVVSLLRARHGLTTGEDNDFQLQRPSEILALRASAAETLSMLLLAIGAVSLVVGGVGIMNIMLVSVTERRREIGVRLAIGARARDIRRQFLVEALLMGAAGGAVGVVIGWAGSWVLSSHFNWPTMVTGDVVFLATTVSIAAAVVFGYYPAYRASGLDPMHAIHTES
jgi:putative ABC transport system permease protein